MFNAYVIEVQDTTAGIVVRDGTRFLFCASDSQFFGLEGRRFASPREAETAARDYADGRNAKLSLNRKKR